MEDVLNQSLLWTPDKGTYDATKDILPTYLLGPNELVEPGFKIDYATGAFGDAVLMRMMMLQVASLYTMFAELRRDVL